ELHDPGWYPFHARARSAARRWPGQAVQVRGRLGVESQRVGQRVEDLRGRMLVAPLLKSQVVVRADAREQRKLLAAQTRHPPAVAGDHPHILGTDLVPAGAQVIAKRV